MKIDVIKIQGRKRIILVDRATKITFLSIDDNNPAYNFLLDRAEGEYKPQSLKTK